MLEQQYIQPLPVRTGNEFENMEMSGGDFANF